MKKTKKKIEGGHYWKLKTNSNYLVLIKYTFLGYVFFQRYDATVHLKKKEFLEHFEYSHYAPTHAEMG